MIEYTDDPLELAQTFAELVDSGLSCEDAFRVATKDIVEIQ